ncbi:MAG: polysaccharide deacetylase family protein [Acidimicrobiia bacterium]
MASRASSVVKAAAASVDLLRRPPPGLVVLIYHRVGRRTAVEVDLPVELFEEQIVFLADACRVVTLEEGLRLAASPPADETEAETVVAVTFDDGTADFAEVAVPVLAKHRVPATLYVATRYVEEHQPFPDDGRPASWAALRDALSSGIVAIGSHTHSHVLLDRVSGTVAADDLDRSISLIGDRLGVSPAHFAYPKAVLGCPDAQAAVRARFRSAAVAGTRPNRFGATDPYRLARSPVQVRDGMRWFTRKARGGLELEDRLRRVLNRGRYRNATT